jgi:hypothetical protein
MKSLDVRPMGNGRQEEPSPRCMHGYNANDMHGLKKKPTNKGPQEHVKQHAWYRLFSPPKKKCMVHAGPPIKAPSRRPGPDRHAHMHARSLQEKDDWMRWLRIGGMFSMLSRSSSAFAFLSSPCVTTLVQPCRSRRAPSRAYK